MTLEESEKRLRTMEDIEEIKQLQARYVNCLITTQWDELIDCFTEDGVVDLHAGLAKGKEAFTKLFKEKIAMTHVGLEGCYVVHPIISVDGDKAKGSWLLYTKFSQPHKIQRVPPESGERDAPDWLQGYYEMEYVRENGKWKISLLKWRSRLRSPRPSE
jgi:ketosteroid isomerase-like protein